MSLNLDYYFKRPDKFPIPGFLTDCTTPADILAFAKVFLTNIENSPKGKIEENHGEIRGAGPTLYNSYYIDSGTVTWNGVTIIGPVYIGRDCEIMPGAVIRPYTIIGDNCSVGHGSELKHAVLFNGAKVASLAFVGDSVLGASARVGSGVITANRKFDQTEVSLKLDGETHALGSDYFGLILGDNSRLGANCTTQPGTHIGANTWIFPGIAVRGFIPEATRVTEDRKLVLAENPIIELKP
jgi:bifunctional UDP-N-acetylglucosamine pyrophosphorylase/glucosamine-1-phosphate N-acetyltransferase